MALKLGIGSPAKDTLFIKEVKRISLETETTEDTLCIMTGRINVHREGKNVEGVTHLSLLLKTAGVIFFYIDFHEHGFFVEPGIGNRKHTHHAPLNRNSTEKGRNQIDDKDKNLIDDMADGQAKDAQI